MKIEQMGDTTSLTFRAPMIVMVLAALMGLGGAVLVLATVSGGFFGILSMIGLLMIYTALTIAVPSRRLMVTPSEVRLDSLGSGYRFWEKSSVAGPKSTASVWLWKSAKVQRRRRRFEIRMTIDGVEHLLHQADGGDDAERRLAEVRQLLA